MNLLTKLSIAMCVVLGMGVGPLAHAKGGEEKPVLVNIDQSAREAFLFTDGGDSASGPFIESHFEVPPGKRLVMEFVSARISAAAGTELVNFQIQLTRPGFTAPIYPQVQDRGFEPPANAEFIVSQPMKVYVDGGTQVWIYAQVEGGPSFANFTVSGYLIPMDEPSLAP